MGLIIGMDYGTVKRTSCSVLRGRFHYSTTMKVQLLLSEIRTRLPPFVILYGGLENNFFKLVA